MAKRKKEDLITRKEKIVDAIDEFAKKGKEFIVYDNDSSFTLIVDGKAAVVSDYETIRGIAGIAGIYDLTPGCKRRKGKRVENSSDNVPGDITPLIAEWKKKAVYEVYVSGLSLPGDTRIVKAGGSFGGVCESMAKILACFGKAACEDLTRPIIASAEGITFVAMPMRIPEAEMERAIKDMERLVG
jgi:hypothetical protein